MGFDSPRGTPKGEKFAMKKYVATVEIEYKTTNDPVMELHCILQPQSSWNIERRRYADDYHIVKQPREQRRDGDHNCRRGA